MLQSLLSKRQLCGALALALLMSVATRGGASAEQAAVASDPGIPPIRLLNGMETIRLDALRIAAYRGSAADNSGKHLLFAERSIVADITVEGPGGRDGAATADDLLDAAVEPQGAIVKSGALAGKPAAGWYTPVYVGRSRDSEDGIAVPAQLILTRQQSSQRINTKDTLAIDPAYDVRRNAPIAHYFDPATGFRPMICHGWPQPFCVWTRTGAESLIIAQGLQGDGSIMEINARKFVPPTGRLLRMQVVARALSGTGDIVVHTLNRPDAGFAVATVTRQGDVVRETIDFSVTSAGKFGIRVPVGVTVELHALGFSMLQPT